MRLWAVLVAGLTALTGAGAAAAAGKQSESSALTHCHADERPIYSCRFGARIGSLCLGENTLSYRYGPLRRPEIDLRSGPDWSNVRFGQRHSQAFSQIHVRLARGPYSYVVHFGEAGRLSEVPGKRISGIAVLKDKQTIADLACRGSALVDPAPLLRIHEAAPIGWEGEDEAFDYYF